MKLLKITLLSLCIFLGINTFAQIGFGAMGGVTFPKINFSGADEIKPKMRTSFTLGGFASYEVMESLDVSAGLMYSGRGTKFDVPEGAGDAYIKLGYLNIPIHATYKYAIGYDDNYVRVFAGPYLGYALTADATEGGAMSAIKRFDIGLDIGAGYQYGPFLANIMYSFGFANLNADEDLEEANVKAKNQVLTIAVGYIISSPN